MEILRTWMLGIVLTGFAIGLAEQLVPNGKEQSAVKFVGGLLMILALLRPLVEVSWDRDVLSAGSFGEMIQLQTETYKEQQQKEYKEYEENGAGYQFSEIRDRGSRNICNLCIFVFK